MEKKFFDWEGWDPVCDFVFNFYNCTLKSDFGSFYRGDVIPTIEMDYTDGEMVFWDGSNKLGTFKLELKIGN